MTNAAFDFPRFWATYALFYGALAILTGIAAAFYVWYGGSIDISAIISRALDHWRISLFILYLAHSAGWVFGYSRQTVVPHDQHVLLLGIAIGALMMLAAGFGPELLEIGGDSWVEHIVSVLGRLLLCVVGVAAHVYLMAWRVRFTPPAFGW